ncbi:MAG: hypothetical protein NTY09_14740, partial [bacterium]|nr:hypothetical protein [bacterium]
KSAVAKAMADHGPRTREGDYQVNRAKSSANSKKIMMFLVACFLAGFIFSGCAKNNPIQLEPSNESIADTASFPDNNFPLASWRFEIDPDTLDYAIAPLRTIQSHLDATPLFTGFCASCLDVKNIDIVPDESISLDITVTHPVPGNPLLDAFDPKVVILAPPDNYFPSGSVSEILQNADGFTKRWSYGQWASINGFIDLDPDDPERRFSSGESTDLHLDLAIPESGPLTFDFVIDVSWIAPGLYDPDNPQGDRNQNEAYNLNATASGDICAIPDSIIDVNIEFSDWQYDGDLASVSLEIPALMEAASIGQLVTHGEISKFASEIFNENYAPPGIYKALVCVRDIYNNPETDSLAVFQIIDIEVTDSIPDIIGIDIEPKIISLSETGQTGDFELYRIYDSGSKSPIVESADWSVEGQSLAGHQLANIDQNGTVTRLSSRWWGGISIVTAKIDSFTTHAIVCCEDPFADAVSVDFGALNVEGDTYTIPENLLGPPTGGSGNQASAVCSLGYGGVATLEFINNIIVNGDGGDFIVFENAFIVNGSGCDFYGDTHYAVWNETAIVEVSKDGQNWYRFPFDYNTENETCVPEAFMDPSSFTGLAGNWPTFASVNYDGSLLDGIDPTDPSTAGGVAFDLDLVGLDWCRFVRIIDTGDPDYPGTEQYDGDGDLVLCYGNVSPVGAIENRAGFDGDSVAAIHSASPLSIL